MLRTLPALSNGIGLSTTCASRRSAAPHTSRNAVRSRLSFFAMKIAVCIKRTPDSESRFKIAGSATGIDEAGLKFDMDDFASYAMEVALQLNEKQGPGETVAFAVGPDAVQETLR